MWVANQRMQWHINIKKERKPSGVDSELSPDFSSKPRALSKFFSMFLTLSWSLFTAPARSGKFPNETLPPNHAIFFFFLIPNRNLSKSDYPNTSIKKPCIHFHSQFKISKTKNKTKQKNVRNWRDLDLITKQP